MKRPELGRVPLYTCECGYRTCTPDWDGCKLTHEGPECPQCGKTLQKE